ncbi:6311_t:CDS:2, partial [Ambispora leptoticha]
LCRGYGLPVWGTRAELEDRIRDQEKTTTKNRIFDYAVKRIKPEASLPPLILTSPPSPKHFPSSASSPFTPTTTPLSTALQSKSLCLPQAKNLEYDLESVEKAVAETLCIMEAAR